MNTLEITSDNDFDYEHSIVHTLDSPNNIPYYETEEIQNECVYSDTDNDASMESTG